MDIRTWFKRKRSEELDPEDAAGLEVLTENISNNVNRISNTQQNVETPVFDPPEQHPTTDNKSDLGTLDSGPARPSQNTYPVTMVNGQKRSFNKSWFQEFPWLEYSTNTDTAYCFHCRIMKVKKRKRHQDLLVSAGFSDWKNAKETCEDH